MIVAKKSSKELSKKGQDCLSFLYHFFSLITMKKIQTRAHAKYFLGVITETLFYLNSFCYQ